ncbi:mechanosensitive ion channel domain-containing protein [Insolitispirillum peregrinum]|uniref:mechanosensitive ion channel domain-containing protein n=1 Tax=Insolitispirillum peregrinum TaxID=80876 RepID=UPI003617B55D
MSCILRRLMTGLWLALWLAGGSLLLPSAPAHAATADGAPSAEALQDLVSTLDNDAKRKDFVDTLKTALAAQKEQEKAQAKDLTLASQLVGGLSDSLGKAGKQLASLGRQFGQIPAGLEVLERRLDTPEEFEALVMGVGKALAVLAIGTLVRMLAQAAFKPFLRRLEARISEDAKWERSALLSVRMVVLMVPPVLMAIAAWVALPLVNASGDVRSGIAGFVGAIALLRGVMVFTDTLLHPSEARLRPVPLTDETAQYLLIWIRRLASIAILGYFSISIAGLLGLPRDAATMLLKLLALVLATMAVMFIMQNRQGVARALRKGTSKPPAGRTRRLASQHIRERLADVWHVLASLYVIAAFVVWVAEIKDGFPYMVRATVLTVGVLVATTILSHVLQALLNRAFAISSDTETKFPGLEQRANRYLPALETVLRAVITLAALLGVLQAWGINTVGWLTEGSGQRVASGLITIAFTLTLALVVWEAFSAWIERYFSTTDEDGNLLERSARARTLLPLARNVLVVILGAMVILTFLSEIGINIAPLLAGAGVVGLAVGFGSQKLVQDVITGAFMLIEDSISVGDVVQAGTYTGTVESMSIRSLRLRDASGNIHTLPFSTVNTITNMTKDYSFYVLNVGVGYREDTDRVCDVLNEIANDLAQDSEFSHDILTALEIQGVDQFAASAVVIRARIKTKPGKQWRVGREFNRRMKKAFDRYGIEIPYNATTLYFGEDRNGQASPMRIRMERARQAAAGIPPDAEPPVIDHDGPPMMGPPSPDSLTAQ